MQANCLETNPNQVSQDDSMKLGVLLMHEDLATGLRGKHALDQVAERLSQKAEFCVHLWRFDLMKEESFRSQAVEDAREANIVVLAMRDHAELPPPVRTWFEEWLEHRGDVPCAVVVSLDSEAEASSPHPALHYVRAVAGPAGVDMFPHYGDTPRSSWDWTSSLNPTSAAPVWMEKIVYVPEPQVRLGIGG